MPGEPPPIVMKKVLIDVLNTQELLNTSITLAKSLESIDFNNTNDSEEFIQKAKSVIDEIKEKVISLNKYFYKHYNVWKNEKELRDDNNISTQSSESDDTRCDESFITDKCFDDSFAIDSESKNNDAEENERLKDSNVDDSRSKDKLENNENVIQNTLDEIETSTDKLNLQEDTGRDCIQTTIEKDINSDLIIENTINKDAVENLDNKNEKQENTLCSNMENLNNKQSSENVEERSQQKDSEEQKAVDICEEDKEQPINTKENDDLRLIIDTENSEIENTSAKNHNNDINIDPLSTDNLHNSDSNTGSISNSKTIESDNVCKLNSDVIIKKELPKIKCVDINKLLNPFAVNSGIGNNSIVEISDSDNEISVKKTNNKEKIPKTLKQHNSNRSVGKKIIVLDDSDNSDNQEFIKRKLAKNKEVTFTKVKGIDLDSKRSKKSNCRTDTTNETRRSTRKRTVKDLVHVSSLSENSSSTDKSDSDILSHKTPTKLKHKKRSVSNESSLLAAQRDKKLSWKPYVPLTKIPAEKLVELFKKKTLNMEINRLTKMENLKRARKQNDGSSDSATSDIVEKKRHRQTRNNKTKNKKISDDSNNSDVSMIDEPFKTSSDMFDDLLKDRDSKKKECDIEEILLDNINSDSDNPNVEGGKDTDKESEEEKNKKKKTQSKNAEKSRKKASDSEKDKKNSDDDSDPERKKEKRKWRKDKLLTNNITDSDSEENFARFMKKKDKKDEKNSDTDDITPRKSKKRLAKRKAKKVLGSDSDSGSSDKYKSDSSASKEESSDEEKSSEEDKKKKKAARRRIRKVEDSSDEEGKDKSTRKSIRKVWNKNALSETTIAAEKAEEERKARIAEKQKKYNQIFELDKLKKASVSKVVLDFNDETEEEILKVDKRIVKHLKPHQAKGIQFMWNACFESMERAQNTKGSGCILAHCMGLGKTLQVIALVHTLLTNEETEVKKVLVVCPLSTVLNWVAEFKKWLPNDDEVEVFELVSCKQNYERMYQVQEWTRVGGALIMGYDMFRNLTNPTHKRLSKKQRNVFQAGLVDPGPQLVICDEGHLLKNEKTSISISMNRITTLRRVVLTGTPLQNNLKEYFCMLQFVKPNLLGTYKEYLNRFVNPITNGQYTDSTPHDIHIMRKRSHVLHKLLDGVVERRDYSVLAPFLPPKHEYVLFVSLTEMQVKLYDHYMKERSGRTQNAGSKGYLFVDFNEFQRICTHPRVLMDKSNQVKAARDKDDILDDDSEGSLKDFIDDEEDEAKTTSSDSGSGSESDGSKKKKKDAEKEKAPQQNQRRTRANAALYEISDTEEPKVSDEPDPSEWWKEFCSDEDLDNINHSGKLTLLFEILKQCEVIGDKVLIFSQSLYSLNVIEYFLNKIDEATQTGENSNFGGYSGSWSLGLDYFRLDGSSSCDNRAAWCNTFNDPENIRARLFLISTRAGGLGINLFAANRVIIFDVSWNPSHDTQSIYRVYRFGQTKPSYIYRFVTMGTMEMKIYDRQVIKQAISKRVVDEQQIDRHYNQQDIAELYNFDPAPDDERPIPLVPKDVLLGELLQMDKKIYKYHEHQSLLENKVDEVLNEEERKAAWEEFENEKKARLYSGTIDNIPVQSIITALQSIARRENPTMDNTAVITLASNMFNTLQEELEAGDSPMFIRARKELATMQAAQQQNAQQYYNLLRQQQALMQQYRLQQQQLYNQGNPQFNNPAMINRMRTQNYPASRMPNAAAFAQASGVNLNPVEYIDLND